MNRLVLLIVCTTVVLLAFLLRAAEFIRFYLKPASAVGMILEWVMQGVMPCRPAGSCLIRDNFGATNKPTPYEEEDLKGGRRKGRRNGKHIVEDALTQAEIIYEDAEEDKTKELQDSGVFYLSWLKVLVSYGDASYFIVGMIAVMCNIFFGTDVGEWGLPRHVEAVLKSFVPVIEANRKKRNNGSKGAEHGYKGGRPRTRGEIPDQYPKGVLVETPNVSDKGKEYGNENLSVSMSEQESASEQVEIPVTVRVWKEAEGIKKKIYYAVLAVFFFRNVCRPEKQTEKFLRYYSNELSMKGRDDNEVVRVWVQSANRWEVQDDKFTRFEQPNLDMWARLYDIAPEPVKPAMLDSSIRFSKEEKIAQIVCPKLVAKWIEDNLALTMPIMRPWVGERHLNYKHPNE